jgi:hypothetical protein
LLQLLNLSLDIFWWIRFHQLQSLVGSSYASVVVAKFIPAC